MYEPLVFIHSWTRWGIVFAAIYFFGRSLYGWCGQKTWASKDSQFVWAFKQVFGYQIAFGLTLWIAFSPWTKAGFKDPSLITGNTIVAFWFLRHPLTMLFAFGVLHTGRAFAKKNALEKRFRIYSVTFGIILAAIASAIPWSALPYGRPLFRWFL